MKIELDKNKLEKLIKAYCYSNTVISRALNVDVGVEKWCKNHDTGYRPRVDLLGLFENYDGSVGKKEVTLDENRITKAIKRQLEKDGYDVEEVKYNCDEKEFGVVEVTVKEKSNRGEMKVENLELYEKCLIVVDMVNGFVREGGLHDPNIAKIIPRQIELIKEAKHEGKLIVFIKDTHNEDAVEFERFGGKHCVEGTNEADLVDELKEFEKDGVAIQKNSTCFMEAPLFRKLMELQKEIKEFDIVGCCTDICVVNGAIALANYLDQNNRKHVIRVHEDAIATYNEDNRKEYVDAAKLLMEQQGIQLVKKGR